MDKKNSTPWRKKTNLSCDLIRQVGTGLRNYQTSGGGAFSRASSISCKRRKSKMISPSGVRRVYDPDTLRLMTKAFERACGFLPVQFRENDRVRTRIASHIIRHINDGENDPVRLADSAVLSVTR